MIAEASVTQMCTPAGVEINKIASISTWSISYLVCVGQIFVTGRRPAILELTYICGNNIFYQQSWIYPPTKTNKEEIVFQLKEVRTPGQCFKEEFQESKTSTKNGGYMYHSDLFWN
jgi:hypothetical protein